MKRRYEVVVMLRDGLLDPQGKTIQDSLPTMGWSGVSGVRVGRNVELTVEAADEAAADAVVNEVAERLLSNPVIEDYRILTSEEVLA